MTDEPMKPYYERDDVTVYNGDCLDVMAGLPANSVDTVLTDPPYGLTDRVPNVKKCVSCNRVLGGADGDPVTCPRCGGILERQRTPIKKGFMGQTWDHGVPGVAFWVEALRVAKPGATLLAFGGTRTHHRLMCAIEDAGWEIRDVIMYVFGAGFPKSLDIGKSLDQAAGAVREVVGIDLSVARKDGRQGNSLGQQSGQSGHITAPSTPLAKTFDGWGSGGLKPAYEPIIYAQKPVEQNYAHNAQVWGVAGLNIDGGRIETGDEIVSRDFSKQKNTAECFGSGKFKDGVWTNTNGRFPSNFVHDGSPEVMKEFERVGESVSGGGIKKPANQTNFDWSLQDGRKNAPKSPMEIRGIGGDSGLPSRYFKECPPDSEPSRFRYCSKASQKDRGNGNSHPTVKPQSLLRYLCRLTKTPYGGVILDPFAGSGSTGLAARTEGRPCILIEKETEYCEIIVNRLNNEADVSPKSKRPENPDPIQKQLALF